MLQNVRQLHDRVPRLIPLLRTSASHFATPAAAATEPSGSCSSSSGSRSGCKKATGQNDDTSSTSCANVGGAALNISTAGDLHSAGVAAGTKHSSCGKPAWHRMTNQSGTTARSAAVLSGASACSLDRGSFSSSGSGRSCSRGSGRGFSVSAALSSIQDEQSGSEDSGDSKQSAAEESSGSSPPEPVDRHVQCTRDIKATQTPKELLTVIQQRAADMNHISLSAAYTKAVTLCAAYVLPEQQPEEVQQLLQVLHRFAGQLQQQCGPRELANIMFSCARLCSASTVKQLLPEFLQDSKLQQANPRDLSTILRAMELLDPKSTHDDPVESNTVLATTGLGVQLAEEEAQQLVQHILAGLSKASAEDAAGTLRYIAAYNMQLPGGEVQQLLRHVVDTAQTAGPRDISETLRASAFLGVRPADDELQQLMQHFFQMLPTAKDLHVANVLRAAAAWSVPLADKEVQQLVSHLVHLLPHVSPYSVADALGVVSLLGVRPAEGDMQQLMQHFFQMLPAAKPKDVADFLRAAAIWNVPLADGEVRQLVQHLVDLLPHVSPYSVANTLLAVSSLGVRPAEHQVQQLMQHFFTVLPAVKDINVADVLRAAASWSMPLAEEKVRQLVQHLVHLLPHVSPYSVATTLQAVAALGVRAAHGDVQQLMQHVAQLSSIQPKQVVQILLALADMEHMPTVHQLAHLTECLEQQLIDARPQDIAFALSACGFLRFAPLQLLSKLEQQPAQLDALVAGLTPQHAAKIAWAYGRLGHRGELLPGVLLQQAVSLLQDGNAGMYDVPSLALLCWSAAMLDLQQHVPHVLQLAAACKQRLGSAAPKVLGQLFQVHIWLLASQMQSTGLATQPMGLLSVLSQQVVQQCVDSQEQGLTEHQAQAQAHASSLERSLFAAAQAQPEGTWQHPPRQRTIDGPFGIHVAATSSSGVRLAIELVGPGNIIQPNGTYTGSTQFRHKMLADQGYVLVVIPHTEWAKLRGSEQQQQQYLHTKVQEALHAAAPAVTFVQQLTHR